MTYLVSKVFEDSGWAEAFQKQDPGNYLGVLGFETNNTIHDDHDGRGPHFHVGLRSPKNKAKERNPAFYMDPTYGGVSQVVYSTSGVELTPSGLFGVVRVEGQLVVGTLVRLRNQRTGMYLYVRESEQGQGQGLFQTLDGNMDDNVTWLLAAVKDAANNVFTLLNVRSNCYACMESDHIVDPLTQSSTCTGSRSFWTLKATEDHPGYYSLANVETGKFMHAFFAQQALPIAQFDQLDDGSAWQLERRSGTAWVPIVAGDQLPCSYTFSFGTLQEHAATLKVQKCGTDWTEVHLTRSVTDEGIGVVEARIVVGREQKNHVIKFNVTTGKQIALRSNQNNTN